MSSDTKIAGSYKTRTKALAITNVVAVLCYLIAASLSWVEPELADVPGASGGAPFVWFLLAVPVFLLSVLSNFIGLSWALIYRWRRGQPYFYWPVWIFIIILWVAAVALDYSRHGT